MLPQKNCFFLLITLHQYLKNLFLVFAKLKLTTLNSFRSKFQDMPGIDTFQKTA